MAKATCENVKAKRVIFKNEKRINLQMNEDEARFLRDVITKVAGYPDTSRRGHAVSIRSALDNIGFTYRCSGDIVGRVTCY